MSPSGKRKAMLLGSAALLASLVVADRAGVLGGRGGGDDEASTPREAYVRAAALVADAEAIVGQQEGWNELLARSDAAWAEARRGMIDAPSAEVAAERLRRMVEAIMSDMGLRLTVSSVGQPRAPLEGEGLRVISLTLDFEAPNPDVVWRLVDRLENLPDVRTNIARLSIVGPGPAIRTGLRVSIDLQGLSWVGGEVAAAPGSPGSDRR